MCAIMGTSPYQSSRTHAFLTAPFPHSWPCSTRAMAGEATAAIPLQLSEFSTISQLQVRKSFVPDVKRRFKIHSYTRVNQQSIRVQHEVQFHWVHMLHFIYSFTMGGCVAVTEVSMNAGMLTFVRQAFLTTGWTSRKKVTGSNGRFILTMGDTVGFLARHHVSLPPH